MTALRWLTHHATIAAAWLLRAPDFEACRFANLTNDEEEGL